MTSSGNVPEVIKDFYIHSVNLVCSKQRQGYPFDLSLAVVYPSWYHKSLTVAAGMPVKLNCYGQHPCLSQDVVIVWHIITMEEEEDRVINEGKEREEDDRNLKVEEDGRDTKDRRDEKNEDGSSYHTNSDLGRLHLQRGFSISGHCRNFSCYSTLNIPAVAVNNYTQVWCGVYTMACPGNEQNFTPPIIVIVEGKHTVNSNRQITHTHTHIRMCHCSYVML